MPDSEKTTEIPLKGTLARRPEPRAQKRRRPKRVKLCDAMRAHGIDENTIANKYVGVMASLASSDYPHADKVLVDLLKEFTRVLKPRKAAERAGRKMDKVVAVQLIHNVPRPVRDGNGPKAEG